MMRLAAFAVVLVAGSTASAQESGGIKGCIDSSIKDGRMQFTHVIESTGDVISRDEWVIRCEGPAALAAWDQFYAGTRLQTG